MLYPQGMKTLSAMRAWLDRHPAVIDWGLVALLCGLTLASLGAIWPLTSTLPWWQAVGLTLLLLIPLGWRRKYPLAVLAVTTGTLAAYWLAQVPENTWSMNAWWLALFSAGVYGSASRRNWVRFGAILCLVALIVDQLRDSDLSPLGDRQSLYFTLAILGNLALAAAVWWFGDNVRVRRQRENDLQLRTMQLEAEREENARRAIFDERVRIARELHDVVAHHVSVMGIQAGAARRVLHSRPDQAEQALNVIESSSREVVAELQQLLGFLRQDTDDDPLSGQPDLNRLSDLVRQMNEAGLPVQFSVTGEVRPLPAGVELSAFRIIQEALTNSFKHGGNCSAAVTVAYHPERLDIAIVDDGRSAAAGHSSNGSGQGLRGMQERVSLLGGTIETGYHPGVGYAVRARLPLIRTPS